MRKHASGAAVDDSEELTRTQPAVASLARGLRVIAGKGPGPRELVDDLTLHEAADMLVRLVAERDAARGLAARLEAENARLIEGGAA